jgi:flagellar biosynthetic protein FliQ
MNLEGAIEILRSAVWVALTLMSPILITSIVVGVIVSIVQTVTSIQEQTLTFVPKLLAVSLVMIVGAHWMIRTLLDYTIWLFQKIPAMAS